MPNVIAINAAARKHIADARATSDEALLESIAKGGRTAMHVLYSRHNVRVYRFVLRMVRDTTMAEDLVSQVFLDVWRTARQFQGRSQVSTWLLSIARFKALTALLAATQQPEVVVHVEIAAAPWKKLRHPAHIIFVARHIGVRNNTRGNEAGMHVSRNMIIGFVFSISRCNAPSAAEINLRVVSANRHN